MSAAKRSVPLRKVAVTGAAGNIGGAVTRRLVELGYDLVLLDKKPMVDPPAHFVETDLRDRDVVRTALQGVEAICHIGEIPNILPGYTPQEVFDINTASCRTMLDVAREVGARRFIYTSSCQRYGYWGVKEFPRLKLPDVWPLDERQSAAPPNAYAESKERNEQQCREASSQAMQVLTYRFPWVLPLRPSERGLRHWAHADQILFEGFWTYLDLRDAVEAYVRGLDPTGPDFGAVGTCEEFHFVSEEVVGELPIREKMARFLPDWPGIPENWGTCQPPVSCAKAERLLGWRPAFRMSAVIRAFREQTKA